VGAKGPSEPVDPERYKARHSAVPGKLTLVIKVVLHYKARHSAASSYRKLKQEVGNLVSLAAFVAEIVAILVGFGVLPLPNGFQVQTDPGTRHYVIHAPGSNSSQKPKVQGRGSKEAGPKPSPSGSSAPACPTPSPSGSSAPASPTPSPSGSSAPACPACPATTADHAVSSAKRHATLAPPGRNAPVASVTSGRLWSLRVSPRTKSEPDRRTVTRYAGSCSTAAKRSR
jgi:hypothetical protein